MGYNHKPPDTVTVIPSGDMARKAFYDRNSTIIPMYFAITVSNHLTTVRWTYTVPTDKKAIHSVLYGRIYPAIATATKIGMIFWKAKESGGTFYPFAVCVHDEPAGHISTITITATFALGEGDAVNCASYHNDSGNHSFRMSSLLTEFDE